MQIDTWLYGSGTIIGVGQDWDGVAVWIARFPGFGRQRVRPCHETTDVQLSIF